MTFSIHMANIVFHDKPVESNGEAEKIRNDPTSSPHSRGTPHTHNRITCGHRIIPAFAGNTYSVLFLSASTKDHPRIRGEHGVRRYYMETGKGSSPHSRGTHIRGVGRDQGPGIIPAFAGNTTPCFIFMYVSKDHPRIRGEHGIIFPMLDNGKGSSPHSRGTRTLGMYLFQKTRIIPAFAGNTFTDC